MQAPNPEDPYIGRENLDIMSLAVNYNNWIFHWVSRGIPAGSKVLDFGAGKGIYANRFSNLDLYAVELDKGFHSHIKAKSFVSIDEIPNDLDVIYALNVMEHIEDDEAMFREFYKHLKPGGEIRILVPARPEIYTKMDDDVGHFRRYTPSLLKRRCTQAGFTITSTGYFDYLGYFATLAYKFIDNSGSINPKTLSFYDKIIFPISTFFDRMTFGKIIGKNLVLTAKK